MKQAKQSFLTILLLLCAVTALNAETYTGSCGTNVKYSLDTSTRVLSITGTGNMSNFSHTFDSSAPWNSYSSYVKTVTISEGVTSIGDYAFTWCSGLTSINIPNSVTSIGNAAFYTRSRLTSITIPNNVTNIGEYACSGCSALTSITIPKSVTSIGYSAFSGCSGLTSIKVDEENKTYDSRENCNAIINSSTNELIAGCRNTIIPNSVTNIGDWAFYDCLGLTSITIPYNVTSIGNYAFRNCTGLTSITIPNGVTSIGSQAFDGCSGLTSITIPNSVISIGIEAFYYCSALKDITVFCSEPPTISSNTFNNYTATIHVLKGCAEAYKNNSSWGKFNIIEDAIDPEKATCATPTIAFANGVIRCSSETPGAACHYSYRTVYGTGAGDNTGNTNIQLEITAYATAEGYNSSDTVTKTFDLTGASASDNCDVNGDGVVNMEDANIVVNKYLGK